MLKFKRMKHSSKENWLLNRRNRYRVKGTFLAISIPCMFLGLNAWSQDTIYFAFNPFSVTLQDTLYLDLPAEIVISGDSVVNGGVPPYSFIWDAVNYTFDDRYSSSLELAIHSPMEISLLVFDSRDCTAQGRMVIMDASTMTYIREKTIARSYKVYPNPTNSIITLRFLGQHSVRSELEFFDLTGKSLHTIDIICDPGIMHSINVEDFPPGIYLLRINSDGSHENHRIIIK